MLLSVPIHVLHNCIVMELPFSSQHRLAGTCRTLRDHLYKHVASELVGQELRLKYYKNALELFHCYKEIFGRVTLVFLENMSLVSDLHSLITINGDATLLKYSIQNLNWYYGKKIESNLFIKNLLFSLVKTGQKELTQTFITAFEDKYGHLSCHENDRILGLLNEGFAAAAMIGDEKLMDSFLLILLSFNVQPDYSWALAGAFCSSYDKSDDAVTRNVPRSHDNIVRKLLPEDEVELKKNFGYFLFSGSKEMAEIAFELWEAGNDLESVELGYLLDGKEKLYLSDCIMDLLIEKVSCRHLFEALLQYSLERSNTEQLEYFLTKTGYQANWTLVMEEYSNLFVMEYCIKNGGNLTRTAWENFLENEEDVEECGPVLLDFASKLGAISSTFETEYRRELQDAKERAIEERAIEERALEEREFKRIKLQ